MRFKSGIISVVIGVFGFSTLSHAQTPAPYLGEVVISQNGALQGSWIEKRTCDEAGVCRTLLMNSETLEVARVNGRLTSAFVATGDGLEVERAEPALDKARRLEGEAS